MERTGVYRVSVLAYYVVMEHSTIFTGIGDVDTRSFHIKPLVKVLKLVDQDKKLTLSIIYEAMDRAKLAIKASVKH